MKDKPTRQEMVNQAMSILPETILQDFKAVAKALEACDYKEAVATLVNVVIIQTAHIGHLGHEIQELQDGLDHTHDGMHMNTDSLTKLSGNVTNLANMVADKIEGEWDEEVNQRATH